MSDAEFQEFVEEMFWRIIEGGGNELRYLDGTTLRDEPLSNLGPWDVRDCALLLRQWLDVLPTEVGDAKTRGFGSVT
jgi:hypothetical protein